MTIRSSDDLIRSDALVDVHCRSCGYIQTMGAKQFASACGTGLLGTIAKRLTCAVCGGDRMQLLIKAQ
jgi:hypothetical protein